MQSLRRSEIDISQDEKRGQDPDQHSDLANFAGADFHRRVHDHSQADSGGDAEGQGRCQHGDEGGNRIAEIIPIDLDNGFCHQRADEDERRSGRVSRNGSGQRRAKDGDQEQGSHGNIRESGARPSGDSGEAAWK